MTFFPLIVVLATEGPMLILVLPFPFFSAEKTDV